MATAFQASAFQDPAFQIDDAAPAVPELGGTILRPHRGGGRFRRKDWLKLLAELQAEIDAVEAKAQARKNGPAKKKLESAAEVAQTVVNELRQTAERASFEAKAVSLKLAMDAAAGAEKTQRVIAEADNALRLARDMRRRLEDDEEEEMIVMLVLN